jgi:hypothetical protein
VVLRKSQVAASCLVSPRPLPRMKKLILGSYEVSEDTKAEAAVPTSTDIASVFSSLIEARPPE